jgi:lipopolysaccharide transport system ATP-binding protein
MSIIEFDHVSKTYQLGKKRGSLREAIAQTASSMFQRGSARNADNIFYALDDVSFKVETGDTLGIIGHNGAGKSTILKLLSKVTFPSSGNIRTKGRVAALIELGAGFHPELSGHDNIYLNASILGLNRRVIDSCYSDIVEFAGLEKFIDTPIKHYSSGMYVRLAFAVAAHIEADVLLVDEVLSVGDTAFQQKCLAKMEELRNRGTTIILVSHNLWTVESFCKRALLLRHGQIETEGNTSEVIQVYRQYEREDLLANDSSGDTQPNTDPIDPEKHTWITNVVLSDTNSNVSAAFDPYASINVRTYYKTIQPIQAPLLVVHICRTDGLVCCKVTNRREAWFAQQQLSGEGYFDVVVGPLPLVPDRYAVQTYIIDSQHPIIHAESTKTDFEINGDLAAPGEAGIFEIQAEWQHPQKTDQNGEKRPL